MLYVCVYDQVWLGGIFEVYISELKTTFVPKVEGRSTRTLRTYEETFDRIFRVDHDCGDCHGKVMVSTVFNKIRVSWGQVYNQWRLVERAAGTAPKKPRTKV